MGIFNFSEWGLFAIVLAFMAASGLVWFSGTRLSRYADELVKKTGIGRVVVGTLLLGGVTSLPEIATTVTASAIGDAEIAVNNLFGGVALQVTVLAIADISIGKKALSSLIGSRAIELQAVIGRLPPCSDVCVCGRIAITTNAFVGTCRPYIAVWHKFVTKKVS